MIFDKEVKAEYVGDADGVVDEGDLFVMVCEDYITNVQRVCHALLSDLDEMRDHLYECADEADRVEYMANWVSLSENDISTIIQDLAAKVQPNTR
jgi:hypothetical protein